MSILGITSEPFAILQQLKGSICKIIRLHHKYKVVMVRHGQSTWNKKNLFCGWYNAPLSEQGEIEAVQAGKVLKEQGYRFDIGFTSLLIRAQLTLGAILNELGQSNLSIVQSWRLNERHYGALTGLNKVETVREHGEEKVEQWRRSYDVPPPPMTNDHPYYKLIVNDPRYAGHISRGDFPRFESLKLTVARTLPFWHETIVPQIKCGKKVIIVAHGNSLRGIVKYLNEISDQDIMKLNLPTGIPFVYTLNKKLKPIGSMEFLGDEDTIKAAMDAVANQTKKN